MASASFPPAFQEAPGGTSSLGISARPGLQAAVQQRCRLGRSRLQDRIDRLKLLAPLVHCGLAELDEPALDDGSGAERSRAEQSGAERERQKRRRAERSGGLSTGPARPWRASPRSPTPSAPAPLRTAPREVRGCGGCGAAPRRIRRGAHVLCGADAAPGASERSASKGQSSKRGPQAPRQTSSSAGAPRSVLLAAVVEIHAHLGPSFADAIQLPLLSKRRLGLNSFRLF